MPVRDTLGVWPALPLIVAGYMTLSGTDDIIAALGQSNRICQIHLWDLAGRQLEEVLGAMQVPFPKLTHVGLFSNGETMPVVPGSILDGSALRLRYFSLYGIPFPGLPNLLLSTTDLVQLWLVDIPHSGYISPEAMVALLPLLSSLEILSLGFQSPQSHPNRETRRLLPSKRSIIPTLSYFVFKGVIDYLEELVTNVDTPQLDTMEITFFNQIDFDCPRLAQFIHCTPTLKALDEVRVQFNDSTANVKLRSRTYNNGSGDFLIKISCREPDWQLSSIEQVCNSFFHPFSTVEDLYIEHRYSELVWKNDAIEGTLWLQLLLPITAMKNLYLSKEFAPGIAAALQELVGDRITEVLPNLENIFVEGLEPSKRFEGVIGQFVATRQLSSHPIVISVWVPWVYAIRDDVEAEFSLTLVDYVKAQKDAALASATTVEERAVIQREYDANMADPDIRAQARAEFQHRVEAERERRLQGNSDGKDTLITEQRNTIHENMMRILK